MLCGVTGLGGFALATYVSVATLWYAVERTTLRYWTLALALLLVLIPVQLGLYIEVAGAISR